MQHRPVHVLLMIPRPLQVVLIMFLVSMANVSGVACLKWPDHLKEPTPAVELCAGNSIQLHFNYTLDTGEKVKEIVWTCQTEGEDTSTVMATYQRDTFMPTADFSGRLEHVQGGEVEMSCATILESGQYSIDVTIEDRHNRHSVYSKEVVVSVIDVPKTYGGVLEATKAYELVYDETSDDWHMQLMCGKFYDKGQPPAEVIWTTPTGQELSSTQENNGTFVLSLSLTEEDQTGSYSCDLVQSLPAVRCLPPDSALLRPAVITVEDTDIRLFHLEKIQREIQKKVDQLVLVNNNQSIVIEQQALELDSLKSTTSILIEQQALELDSFKNTTSILLEQQALELDSLKNTTCDCQMSQKVLLKSCVDWQKVEGLADSGVRTIFTDPLTPVKVYCDQDTDNGGWTVFQRRMDGSVDFYRNWTEYQTGFGDPSGEFWLGLNALHMMTSSTKMMLRVDLEMWNGTKGFATYPGFNISGVSDNYRLQYDSFTGGNAGDSLSYHRGRQFSTFDADHDTYGGNCAEKFRGAWWYGACHNSNLNGDYKADSSAPREDGLIWTRFAVSTYSIKSTEMKLRPMA